MNPDVVRTLGQWAKLRGLQCGDFVFVEENGGAIDQGKLSRRLRWHVRLVGIDHPELLNAGTNRGRLRVHGLRGTFVTLSLANGKMETWVQDRTGHASSVMINRLGAAGAQRHGTVAEPPSTMLSPPPPRPLGGTAYAGDLKSSDLTVVPVRVREGLLIDVVGSSCFGAGVDGGGELGVVADSAVTTDDEAGRNFGGPQCFHQVLVALEGLGRA